MNYKQMPDETAGNTEVDRAALENEAGLLQNAYDSQNKQQLYANLLRSFQGAVQSAAPQSGYKADPTIANSMEQQSSQPVTLVKEQMAMDMAKKKQASEEEATAREKEKHNLFVQDAKMKLDAAQIKMEDTKLGDDPNSNISKVTREIAKEWLKLSGKSYDEKTIEGLTGNQLVNMIPDISKIGMEYLKEAQSKRAADQSKERNELLRQQIKSREQIAKDAVAAKTAAKTTEPSFKQKEEIKAQAKEDVQIKKENRKERTQLQKDYQTWDVLEKQIDDAIAKVKEYNKGSGPGTGVIAKAKSMVGSLAPEAQSLDTSLQKLSMDQLVKQFSGMSKAIDTPAERAAFQATVPTIGMDDALLMQELEKRKEAAKAAKERIQTGMNRYDKTGKFNEETPESDFVMMQAPDGSPPVKIRKDQAQKYLDKGAKIVQPGQ